MARNMLFKQFSLILLTVLIACSTSTKNTAEVTPKKTSTFVLVHGALFTGAGWKETEIELNTLGQKAISLDVPGRPGDG